MYCLKKKITKQKLNIIQKLKKFRKPSTRFGAFNDFYIWTQVHVKSYWANIMHIFRF